MLFISTLAIGVRYARSRTMARRNKSSEWLGVTIFVLIAVAYCGTHKSPPASPRTDSPSAYVTPSPTPTKSERPRSASPVLKTSDILLERSPVETVPVVPKVTKEAITAKRELPPASLNFVPKTVKLEEGYPVTIFERGQSVGVRTIPAGTVLLLKRIKGDKVVVEIGGATQEIPATATDLIEQMVEASER